MGRQANPSEIKEVSILDPGCGLAILSCALIEYLVEVSSPVRINLTLYETDKKIIPFTLDVLYYLKAWCEARKVQIDYHLNETDFVLDRYECL